MKLTGRNTPLLKVRSTDFIIDLCKLMTRSEEAKTAMIGFIDNATEEEKEEMKTNNGLIVVGLWWDSSYGVEDIIEALRPIESSERVVVFLEGWLSGRIDE